MRVLVACEFSGIVRDAFIAQGHEAVSCDLLPSERPGPHIQDDVRRHLLGWDMVLAFPPCTYLAASGRRWWKDRKPQQEQALNFVRALLATPVPRLALENPRGAISWHIRRPDQEIQPWQFGHGETKTTGLWLKNLPLLQPTDVVPGREQRIFHALRNHPERAKERSRTYPGVAAAMAAQWGAYAG